VTVVLITAAFAAALAFVLGVALGFFKEFFAVPQDPLAGRIREALPGANCGACGFPAVKITPKLSHPETPPLPPVP